MNSKLFDMNTKAFGKHLKLIREKQNISVSDFCAMTGFSKDTIWDLEAGKRPPGLETLVTICNTLNISPEYLLSAEFDPAFGKIGEKSPALMDSLFSLSFSEVTRIKDILQIVVNKK